MDIDDGSGAVVTSLLEFDLASGGTVSVEVEPGTSEPVTRGGFAGEQVVKAVDALDEVVERLCDLIERIGAPLQAASVSADDLEVAFAVKLSADANFVIARTGAEANFSVTMRWAKSESSGHVQRGPADVPNVS